MAERATACERLERILHILPAAAREGGASLPELAASLNVEIDDIVSDLTEVTNRSFYLGPGLGDELQIHIESDRVQVWTTGEFHRPVSLSARECLCLALGLRASGLESEATGDTTEPRAAPLLKRLEAHLATTPASEMAEAVEVSDLEPDERGIRDTLFAATREHRVCAIEYLKPDESAPVARRVCPYLMAHAEGLWYAISFCKMSEGVRSFRVDRVLSAVLEDETFEVPDNFDAEEYVQGGRVFRADQELEVPVRYSPKIARWIAERGEGEAQPDGGYLVVHRVADPHWLVRHVLQYGAEAEVVGPEEVRGMVREWATRFVQTTAGWGMREGRSLGGA